MAMLASSANSVKDRPEPLQPRSRDRSLLVRQTRSDASAQRRHPMAVSDYGHLVRPRSTRRNEGPSATLSNSSSARRTIRQRTDPGAAVPP